MTGMTGILLCCAAILLLVGALYLILCHEPLVAAWWYRVFHGPEPYPPEAAEAPDLVERAYTEAGDTFGFQRTSYYVDGGHPKDCTEKCCFEIRLTELHDAFDWHAAEHEMRSKR